MENYYKDGLLPDGINDVDIHISETEREIAYSDAGYSRVFSMYGIDRMLDM